ncbi:cytochrome-c peroxidase [Chryseobacterium sp. MP_3.2]|uniref:cytochrome-c peroxidase n=1 Tax=Chryseobacterium sp. MP_3.2 TaxID=3071712 RepID=UPI002E0C979E|nr:cytochrome c peroxidase [Chryseobacterium sp. MP_3.2]
MKTYILPLILFLFVIVYSCSGTAVHQPIKSTQYTAAELKKLYSSGQANWPIADLDETVKNNFEDIGHLPATIYPEDNLYSKEKEKLGKTLFFDPRLSSSKQIACASCHDPDLAWTDNKTLSFGHDRQLGARNAMTIINSAHINKPFWDGRANSLEEQAQMPVEDPREMNEHLNLAVGKISAIKGYEKLFIEAFGTKEVSKEKIGKAIATFERSIKSGSTKFDRFIDGDEEVYSDQEVTGLHLFRTKAQCINCHNTGYFSNNQFENDGTALLGSKQQDLGRYLVTLKPEDVGKFRVPTLREITRTGPWMHNGAFMPLIDVLTFYNVGNPEPSKKRSTVHNGIGLVSQKSKLLKPLNLTKGEMEALESFLETLSSKTQRLSPPPLPK